jgi:hypothetical protein
MRCFSTYYLPPLESYTLTIAQCLLGFPPGYRHIRYSIVQIEYGGKFGSSVAQIELICRAFCKQLFGPKG